MKNEEIQEEIQAFAKSTHGSTDFDRDEFFIVSSDQENFLPFNYLKKKNANIDSPEELVRVGFVIDSYDLVGFENFPKWFENQFARKLPLKKMKEVKFIYYPDTSAIFNSIEKINSHYDILKKEKVLLNKKNLPVQLGEWLAKSIFGLRQVKSTSQRGFDFYLQSQRAEVKVTWGAFSSPKGIKLRRSLVELSDYCIIMYISPNLMIREICFLDSDFVLRRFAKKGHTIFLKDTDIQNYFFSNSTKHIDKVINSTTLLKYSLPTLAMKISENFQ